MSDNEHQPRDAEAQPYGPEGPRKTRISLAIRKGLKEWAFDEYLAAADRVAQGLSARTYKEVKPSKLYAFWHKLKKYLLNPSRK